MDVKSELNLHKNVEFLPPTLSSKKKLTTFKRGSVPNKTATNQRQNPNAKNWNNKKQFQRNQAKSVTPQKKSLVHLPKDPFKLSAYELLFFPKHHNSKPSSIPTPDDFTKKNKYLNVISKMPPGEQRKLRSQRDARYINKPAKKPSETEDEEEQQFCYNHLFGRCNTRPPCDKWHQLRPPRYIGVCKYYLSGCCTNDMCQFMHEDYPCRFYYLDLEHPKSIDGDNCRFMHGGPLPKRLYYYFKKQIELWVKKRTEKKPEDFDSVLTEYIDKFETKLAKLEQEHQNNSTFIVANDQFSIADDKFSIASILTNQQIKALAEKNITTAAQINQVPIDDLIDFGLTMDQIYTITTNTCNESSQSQIMCEDSVDKSTNDDVLMSDITLGSSNNVKDSSSVVDPKQIESNVNSQEIESNFDFEPDTVLFFGFAEIEMREAEQILQTKRRIFQMDPHESPSVSNENELAAKICETEIANEKQNVNLDNTDDSDSEFGLVINEDV